VPNWPINAGSAPTAAAAASGLAAAGFAVAGFSAADFSPDDLAAPFGDAVCACTRLETPHTSVPAIRAVSIRRTDIAKSGLSSL
jgi:hypothetical protein